MALIVGTVLGFLAGLGVGGGSLLVLWLTQVVGMDSIQSRAINLLFFLPCAAVSCYFQRKQGSLPRKKLLPAIAAGCACAGVFSWLGTSIEVSLLKKLFAWLLLITGIREIRYCSRDQRFRKAR